MSAENSELIVLFKALSEAESKDEDIYSNFFRSVGFEVALTPVLDFEFVNSDELLVKLNNPDGYEGIIFTSPRCVTAVELSVRKGNESSVLEKWQKHKHFVVGEKTGQMIEKFNFIPNGKEAGNAKNLAEIMSREHFTKPFLYPKGSLTKETFKLLLTEIPIKVDEIMVYRTKPHPDLEANIQKIKALCFGKIVYFVYFSPSGVTFTLPLLERNEFYLNEITFIAIGPTTEQALRECGLMVGATAAKPEPNALLDAISMCKKSCELKNFGSFNC